MLEWSLVERRTSLGVFPLNWSGGFDGGFDAGFDVGWVGVFAGVFSGVEGFG